MVSVRLCVVAAALLLAGCGGPSEEDSTLGEAYVGPATLVLRADIPLESPATATVKHGERLEIVRRRRVFYLLRTASGTEGWTSERNLLNHDEIGALHQLAKQAADLPPQGKATVFAALNVHTLPVRKAPSFIQIREKQLVDVLLHRVEPRNADVDRPPLIPPAPKREKKRIPRKPVPARFPPMPAAPPAPANWVDLSLPTAVPEAPPEEEPEAEPAPMDDWSLVRTPGGQAGWVLSSRLYMAIPDEVAQYAEGRRITAYFSLGEVPDGDRIRHNWLWTTIESSGLPYDFDSFRVFIWNVRRHRFETAYIQRRVKGFFPVRVHPVQYGVSTRRGGQAGQPETYPGFSVCIEKSDGLRYRQSFAFIVNIVRFAGEQPCEVVYRDRPAVPPQTQVAANESREPKAEERSVYDRLKLRVVRLARQWLR